MKSYPAHISVNMLAELTGRDRRTIVSRLEKLTPVSEGPNGVLYEIRAAVRMIFDFNPDDESQTMDYDGDGFQPLQEKAKLDFVKRQSMELALEEKKRNLIPKDEIQEALENVFSNIKTRLLAIPTRAAQVIIGPPQKQTEAVISKLVNEALTELAEAKLLDEENN